MKPEINIALMNAAQEILTRFSPLIEDEYEQSRLNSWGALILISAMKLNQSYSSLVKENNSMINWLTNTKQIYSKELFNLLREMHSHRKVSDLIGLLQQADS